MGSNSEKRKPVIFLAFANDVAGSLGHLRNLPEETRQLRDVLRMAEQAGLCDVVVRPDCTADDIFKVFQDPEYVDRIAVFHYGGHASGYQLLLESANGEPAAANAGGLASFLGQQLGLQLVFLNGCSTRNQTDGLLAANVPTVISTACEIDDQVATEFATLFYRGLAGGASVSRSFKQAESAVETTHSGVKRLAFGDDEDAPEKKRDPSELPWGIFPKRDSDAEQWSLSAAVNDSTFGLPPLPEQDLPSQPFRHLKWFTRKDAEIFFGRGDKIREFYDRLNAPRSAPVTLFFGQSGVGKSSLLDAGLLPRLESNFEVVYLRRGDAGLVKTLESAFDSSQSINAAWISKEEKSGKPLIVFLDQVEEIFTRPVSGSSNELDELLAIIKETFVESERRPKGKLVLGFRKEWLAELEARLDEQDIPSTKVFLEPLNRGGIIEIVVGLTESKRLRDQYGLTVEDLLPENIADDLLEDRGSAIAPALQILLTKMWVQASKENYEGPRFTIELYQQLKRDGILLRDFLEQQIEKFRERYPEAVDSGLLLDIVAMHTTPLGTADQRTVEELQSQYSHLNATLPDLLQQCQDLYLLTVTSNKQSGSSMATRLAHDTLAPLVRERFDVSDKPGQRARRILDNRSVDWEQGTGTPLDQADLKIVEQGVNGTRSLSPTEQRLLDSSRDLRRKLQRTKMLVRMGAGLAAAAIVLVSLFAFFKSGEAKQANVTAVLTSAPSEFGETLNAVDSSLAKVFVNTRDNDSLSIIPRLHAAFAVSHLEGPKSSLVENDQFLVENLGSLPVEELPNFLDAMSSEPDPSIVGQFAQFANDRADGSDRSVAAAAVLVALGKLDQLETLIVESSPDETRGNPNLRTKFVHGYHNWIAAPERLGKTLQSLQANETGDRVSRSALAAICQALMFCEEADIRAATKEPLLSFAKKHGDAAVLASARRTLVAWDVEVPESNAKGDNWYINKAGMTMVEVPFDENDEGKFTWLNIKNDAPDLEVRLTRRYSIADTEVTLGQWNQWPDRPQRKDELKWVKAMGVSDSFPRGYVKFFDAVKYCNWLSENEGLKPCYKFDSENEVWDCDFTAGGYRLPTEAEWRYACRGGSNTRYCFGDDPQLLHEYAWTVENSLGQAGRVATRMPNGFGLFDMHGNLLEWCWDWYEPMPELSKNEELAEDFAGPTEQKASSPFFAQKTACGGDFRAGSEFTIADDRGSFGAASTQRYLGFRVVQTRSH